MHRSINNGLKSFLKLFGDWFRKIWIPRFLKTGIFSSQILAPHFSFLEFSRYVSLEISGFKFLKLSTSRDINESLLLEISRQNISREVQSTRLEHSYFHTSCVFTRWLKNPNVLQNILIALFLFSYFLCFHRVFTTWICMMKTGKISSIIYLNKVIISEI